MQFPARDFTNQYISASYQDVLQKYDPSDIFYVLDGFGNVIFALPSASVGQMLITSDITSSMTVASASYAVTQSYTNILIQSSSFASSSVSSSYSVSSSHSENADNADFSLAAYYSTTSNTASYLRGSGLIRGGLLFDTSSVISINQEGYIYWDNESHTLAIKPNITASTLQVGQETWIQYVAGEDITNGDAIYIATVSDADGHPVCKKAIADGSRTKYSVVAIATNDALSGSHNYATVQGIVNDLDMSSYPPGSPIYLSEIIPGGFRLDPPSDPYERILLGYCANQNGSVGRLLVNIVGIPDIFKPFVGLVNVPPITNLGAGNFTVGTSSVNLCTTSDGTGPIRTYPIPSASFYLTSSFLDAHYVYVTYNSGSPIYSISTNKDIVDDIQTTLVYTVTMGAGSSLSYVSWDQSGELLANKQNRRVIALRGIERESGLNLGESGSRYVTVSDGYIWQGIHRIYLSPVTSSVNRLVLAAHSASVWSGSLVTQYVNDVYDDGNNLVSLTGNRFVTNWVYRGIGNLNTTVIQLSNVYSKLADAVADGPPTPPPELKDIAILTGRAIFQQNGVNASLIESAFGETFGGGITTHNYLLGLQGGTDNEYYHLTFAEYTQLQSGTSSYSNRSLTASYAENAGSGGTILETGSFYPITSSWSVSASWAPGNGDSISASYALTASYALNAGQSGGTTLETGSFYPITSSWSQYALTASYVNVIPSGSTESASYATTSSHALTASYVSNVGGLSIPPYDYSNIIYSGPNGQIGTCTYRLGGISGSIVAEVTAIYSGNLFIGVSKSLG
jgi:hypothetical protein